MDFKWKNCFKVGVTVFLLYLCVYYWSNAVGLLGALISSAFPLILGFVIAYVVNILMSVYERHYFPKRTERKFVKSRRPVCMLAAFLTVLAIVGIITGLVIPQLMECLRLLIAKAPGAISNLIEWLKGFHLIAEDALFSLNTADLEKKFEQIIAMLSSGMGNLMGTLVGTIASAFSGIVTFLLSFIFSIYLLLGKEGLKRQFKRMLIRYLKKSWYKKIMYVCSVMNECFHRYIVGQCTEAVILGSLCTIGMAVIRLPYATMIGALIAFTALIPVAGAYIGAGVGAFMILTVSPVKALIFLVFILVLQQLEGNIIYPKVVGASMGLPAIWVLAAVTIGGGMLGILGMLLGVPLAATLYRLLKDDINKEK